MTSQEKKEVLKQYKELDDVINEMINQKAELWSIATKITPTLSDMPAGAGGTSKVESIMERIVLLEEKINNKIDEFINLKTKILSAIYKIRSLRLQKVLILKYIKGKTLEEISVEMVYCYKQTCRLHGQALQLIQL